MMTMGGSMMTHMNRMMNGMTIGRQTGFSASTLTDYVQVIRSRGVLTWFAGQIE